MDPQGLPAAAAHRRAGVTGAGVELAPAGSQTAAGRVWVAQVGRIPLLLLDSTFRRTMTLRNVTDQLVRRRPGNTASSRNCWPVSAARARSGVHRRVEGIPARTCPHERGPRGFRVERVRDRMAADNLDFDTALTVVRSNTVFTTHTRCRPASTASRWRWCSATSAATTRKPVCCPVCRWRGCSPSAPDGSRRSSTWPTWACAMAQRPNGGRCCTAGSAARCSQRSVAGLRPGRGAHRFDHQRGARADVGGAAVVNWVSEPPGRPRRCASRTWWRLQQVDSGSHLVDPLPAARRSWSEDVRAQLRRSWLERGAAEAELRLDRNGIRSRRADDRVRPPGADLQSA